MPYEIRKDKLPQCRLYAVLVIWKNLLKTVGIFAPELSKTLQSLDLSLEEGWVYARGVEKPWHVSRGVAALVGAPPGVAWPYKVHRPQKVCIKARNPPDLPYSSLLLGSSSILFLYWKLLETPFFFTFLDGFASEHWILSDLNMDVLGLKTYDNLVELEWENFHERELKRWWNSFSSKDRAYIK